MPVVPINYLAVLACAIVSMVLGFLWYGPLFGKQWIALSGIKPEHMEGAKQKGMGKLYALAFVGSLVMAFALAHSLVFASAYLKITGISAGLQAGFWSWLGFIAPVTLGTVLWDGKPWKLWLLTNSYYLLQLLIFGIILAKWV